MTGKNRISLFLIVATTSIVTGRASDAVGQERVPQAVRVNCADLRGKIVAGLAISTAQMVEAGKLPGEAGDTARPDAPPHCLIEGAIDQRLGADGKPYAINIQIRMPVRWDGRLLYQGGGGLNGIVPLATGNNPTRSTAPNGLQRGMAVVTTDSGHTGQSVLDPAFARDSQAKIDFAYAAIGKVTVVAKAVTEKLAGHPPHDTYFSGCSNGGREALIAAGRYPTLFDGVAAGNPAFNVTTAGLMAYYSTQQYRNARVTAEDLRLVGTGVRKACDELDGRADGLIFNQAACHFRARSLTCRPGLTSACLSTPKAAAIDRAFRGPLGASGQPMFASWAYDTGVGTPEWLMWQTGEAPVGSPMQNWGPKIIDAAVREVFSYPPLSPDELKTLNYVAIQQRMAWGSAIIDATSTDFSTFRARGGKILLSTGISDPIFAPSDLIRWYRRLGADTKAVAGSGVNDFARLFLSPGVTHCGGNGLDDFDSLTALVDWVEGRKAPDFLVARSKAMPKEERPLCAYPRYAAFQSGSGHAAGDYVCKAP